jgi:anti-sigma factor RsiW
MNWSCETLEERLSDHLDGLLSAKEERSLAAHLEKCARCSALVAQVSGTVASVHRLYPVLEPPELIPNILEKTLGRKRRKSALPVWLGWLQPVWQPRVAMGFAMVLLTAVLSAQATGLDIRQLQWKDLHPMNVYRQTNRQAHLLYARGVKFVNDLRVVNEIQSRLQSTRQREQDEGDTEKKKETDPNRSREENRNFLDHGACESCLVTTALPPLAGGVSR